ncbi:MAG: class I SAM-dependent methyltransferase, partial [Gemmataceae bacterium]
LQDLADSVPCWWHSIDLGHGVVTRGRKTADCIRAELASFRLPELRGKSVLDIGAWDGVYSFEAERLGADRVVALDYYAWSLDQVKMSAYWTEFTKNGRTLPEWHMLPGVWQPDTLPGKTGFDTAHRALDSKVEAVVGDFLTMDLDTLGTFDVVLFLGVLYHLRDPLGALQRVARLTRELAVIETAGIVVPGREDLALCEFYPSDELCKDPTNWWAPNAKALEGLCLAAGFGRAEVLNKPRRRPFAKFQRCRHVAHAWK